MNSSEMSVFEKLPFLFWIKDREGKYLWGNRKICELAGEEVAGKTDAQLPWANNAVELRDDDLCVFASGEPIYSHEFVDKSSEGRASLSVCKWLDEFEGQQCCFGISFICD
ncbi:PAS domain-containing protein [uncultured Microbulbifer sp.]|uniref:PAS domain-containing protein n=1 Tax=uncultured Microbulbifer sp. TaxID=348147 RepID=UPI002630CC9E|nr:PAS domain-containing protein [uncultured Microbulbifer sp.]